MGPGGILGGCTHATVQAAVNTAAANPGPDEIRIAMGSNGYTNQAIVVNAQDLTLSGGFADCQPFAPIGRTRLSGAGGAAAPVLKIQSTTGVAVTVQLDRLELVEGDHTAVGVLGGGLAITDNSTVTIANSRIANNSGYLGAGIAVNGTAGGSPLLIVAEQVQIEDNFTPINGSGGGIFVRDAHLRLGGVGTVVRRNRAVSGAGIYVVGNAGATLTDVELRSGGEGDDGLLAGNLAGDKGGALYVSGNSRVRAYTDVAERPLRIEHNQSNNGGAVYALGHPARVEIWNGMVSGNLGRGGGGAFAVIDGASVLMAAADASAPSGTVACADSGECNRLLGNRAGPSEPATFAGAVAQVRNSNSPQASLLVLDSITLSGHRGSSLFDDNCFGGVCGGERGIYISNSLVATNPEGGALLFFNAGAEFACAWCTLAGFTPSTTQPLIEGPGRLALLSSILWQPGREIIGQPPSELLALNLLLHSAMDFPVQPDIRVGDPRFLAAGAGDFRLAIDSPAIDSSGTVDAPLVDLDGNPRVVDQPAVPNRAGPIDLGAYERPLDGDLIFRHSFE